MILCFVTILFPSAVLLGFVVGFARQGRGGVEPPDAIARRRKLAGAAGRTAMKLAGKAALHWLGAR